MLLTRIAHRVPTAFPYAFLGEAVLLAVLAEDLTPQIVAAVLLLTLGLLAGFAAARTGHYGCRCPRCKSGCPDCATDVRHARTLTPRRHRRRQRRLRRAHLTLRLLRTPLPMALPCSLGVAALAAAVCFLYEFDAQGSAVVASIALILPAAAAARLVGYHARFSRWCRVCLTSSLNTAVSPAAGASDAAS